MLRPIVLYFHVPLDITECDFSLDNSKWAALGKFNPLAPMSDQDRISPYNINTVSSKQVRRIKLKTQLGDYKLIQYQILQTDIMSL